MTDLCQRWTWSFYVMFSNQMSSMTPKVVMFNMDVGEAPSDGKANLSSYSGLIWEPGDVEKAYFREHYL